VTTYSAARAGVAARLGFVESARRVFEGELVTTDDDALNPFHRASRLFRVLYDLALARRADGARDAAAAREHRRRAEREVQAAERATPLSFAGLLALRIARHALAEIGEVDGPSVAAHVLPVSASEIFWVHRAGLWFRLPGAPPVSLRTRGSLARILACLAAYRAERPGIIVAFPTLIDAGWPGVGLRSTSGQNRLKVAVATLRGFGLRDVLRSGHAGYYLDPNVPLLTADEADGAQVF
jgi:hypothetical protein